MKTFIFRFREHGALGIASFFVIATDYEMARTVAPDDKWEYLSMSQYRQTAETRQVLAQGSSNMDLYRSLQNT